MRKFCLITAIVLSATAAHASSSLNVASSDAPPATQPPAAASTAQPPAASSSAQVPDAAAIAAQRQAMIEQKMAIQKQMIMQRQMAMQRQMQLHPIRTRLQIAFYKFKRKMRAF